jgi:hypothetical protein
MTGVIAKGVVVSISYDPLPLEFKSSKVSLLYKFNTRGAEGKH